ncbi:MAG: hypothetical protein K2W96_21010 [Gemmataceae bacterium]|nr:hypothetical protein [Gemmataceae bacterium]
MDLKIDDLCGACPRCEGHRSIETVEGGSGMRGVGPTRWFGPCPNCAGSGTKLAALGEVLAQFASRRKVGRI